MRRRSPPTDRVIALLDVLAARPGQALTSSEIARQVDVTRTTCHSLLMTLADASYLVRDPRAKTYTLGPALIALGQAAQRSFPSIQLSRGELERLHRRTGMPCTATAVVGGDLVMIDSVGDDDGATAPGRNRRTPLAAPFGALHVAWSGPEEMAAWIERAAEDTTNDRSAEYQRLLDALRRQRYTVTPLDEAEGQLRGRLLQLADDMASNDLRSMALTLASALRSRDYLPEELGPGRKLDVESIAAPVFHSGARPDFTVALHVHRPQVSSDDVATLASDLLDATRRMTRLVGGGEPASAVVEDLVRSGPRP
ncbi:MAG TPA: helix-turn-helix domain-containing protein [Acidimicrobiales bacterium]|nr:helix-turn-helix domain-containing protein [Acidimicrobiales bacterium]